MFAKVANRFNRNKRKREINTLIDNHRWTELLSSITGTESFSVPNVRDIASLCQVAYRMNTYKECGRRYKVTTDKENLVITVTMERL